MSSTTGGKRPSVSGDDANLFRTVANLWPYMWPSGRPDLRLQVVLAIGALLVSILSMLLNAIFKPEKDED